MDIFKSLFSSSHMLIEQLMGEMRSVLPDEGVSMAIIDEQGNLWSSDHVAFERAGLEDELDAICGRVCDGDDPLMLERGGLMVAVSELCGEQVHCGYVMLLIDSDQVGSAEGINGVVSMVLGQVNLAVRLIEKNNRLHQERLAGMAGGRTTAKACLS